MVRDDCSYQVLALGLRSVSISVLLDVKVSIAHTFSSVGILGP